MNSSNGIDKSFDEELKKRIDIYKRYPEMLPKVGKKYRKTRFLLVCESYYFEDKWEACRKPEWWYKNTSRQLKKCCGKEPLSWINIRKFGLRYPNKKPRPWAILAQNIIETKVFKHLGLDFKKFKGENFEEEAISYCAAMNYFTRPANREKGGFTYEPPKRIDEEKSAETLLKVIDMLEPKLICFASKKSYGCFVGYCKQKNIYEDKKKLIEAVSVPLCPWWNRDDGRIGWKAFRGILKKTYSSQRK